MTVILFLLLNPFQAAAQPEESKGIRFEADAGLGASFFLGDLGGNIGAGSRFLKDLNFNHTRTEQHLGLSMYLKPGLGLRFAFNHLSVEGNDASTVDRGGSEQDRYLRNLSFRSPVTEWQLTLETELLRWLQKDKEKFTRVHPYVFGGFGIFHFDPKAKTNDGQWHRLHPLRLEGQGFAEYPDRKPYKLTQTQIPFGAGIKYYFNPHLFTAIELNYRHTWTDYIDDVSTGYIEHYLFDKYLSPADANLARQLYYRGIYPFAPTGSSAIISLERGNPHQNDNYFTLQLRFGWRFSRKTDEDSKIRHQHFCTDNF